MRFAQSDFDKTWHITSFWNALNKRRKIKILNFGSVPGS